MTLAASEVNCLRLARFFVSVNKVFNGVTLGQGITVSDAAFVYIDIVTKLIRFDESIAPVRNSCCHYTSDLVVV
jgi:hypothetical protein